MMPKEKCPLCEREPEFAGGVVELWCCSGSDPGNFYKGSHYLEGPDNDPTGVKWDEMCRAARAAKENDNA